MDAHPQLIVMLTHHDQTVLNAPAVFEQCRHSKALFWGMKEIALPLEEMRELCTAMKQCGKTTFLEVVSYTERECMKGAETAAKCGFDVLMGTRYFDSVHAFCKHHHMKYMPFVGKVSARPSILEGSIEEIVEEAQDCLAKGVDGFDLLGYRYTGDGAELNRIFTSRINAPVCIAGSIDSFAKLEQVKKANPWAFTIGSAFFEQKFGTAFEEQINTVCRYMKDGSNETNGAG